MGLDITAYSRLTFVEVGDDEWESKHDYETHTRVWVNEDFPGQAEGLTHLGVYRLSGKRHRFRAGSYVGYNQWRAQLARFAFGVEPDHVWRNPGLFAGKPFAELIHFSDCEGTIGPAVSAKLARDFADHQAGAVEWAKKTLTSEDAEWFVSKYEDWLTAFTLAADGGAVCFH